MPTLHYNTQFPLIISHIGRMLNYTIFQLSVEYLILPFFWGTICFKTMFKIHIIPKINTLNLYIFENILLQYEFIKYNKAYL